MHNNQAAQPRSNNLKDLSPADAWLKIKVMPKATKENPEPKAVQVSRDVPMSLKGLVARSMINAEKAHQEANPGAEPIEFTITGTINIVGANDDKADLVF